MAYLLDADVFIRAKNLHYGFDFCPAFWDWLIASNGAGRVFSVEKVGDEVRAVADELSEWADERGTGFFLRPDSAVFPALAAVSAWAGGQGYEPSAVNTFLQVADYYRGSRPSGRAHGGDARDSLGVDSQDQDPRCLYRPRHQVHDPVRDAAARESAVRPRALVMKHTREAAFETRFRLPRAVDERLQALLDRQDRGGELSPDERSEAEGLVELAEPSPRPPPSKILE